MVDTEGVVSRAGISIYTGAFGKEQAERLLWHAGDARRPSLIAHLLAVVLRRPIGSLLPLREESRMSLLDKLKSFFGGSQSAPSDSAAPSDAPAIGESTTGHTPDHEHESHEHSHVPLGGKPEEPTQG